MVTDSADQPNVKPLPTGADIRKEKSELYYASMYSQLIIYGKSPGLAAELAKEATDHLLRNDKPFPELKVG